MMVVALVFSFSSCEKNDNGPACNWDKEYADYEAKLNAYAADVSSVSKCNALKQSAINLLGKLKGCSGVGEIEAAINQWKDINCNNLSHF
ncbi:hypothetical protein SAMN05421747_106150 [Parapedobacter composti]|uniref:Uncharacterized protein n=2 Tax=Parapedobacter composti TaxID=623281 RepID=A0A1I1HED7_9SPHI|nr:hypothetical protein SAMN05421747_106150 [Parapedobacter composti]